MHRMGTNLVWRILVPSHLEIRLIGHHVRCFKRLKEEPNLSSNFSCMFPALSIYKCGLAL